MEGRAGHVQAVETAKLQVQELENGILAVLDKYPETLNLVIEATGEDPIDGPGRQALELTTILTLKLEETASICASIRDRLTSYGMTF